MKLMTGKDVAIAVDVGGSSLKCALVDRGGQVMLTRRYPTGRERGPSAVAQTIIDAAVDLADIARVEQFTPVAAGVVVPAVVDEAKGVAVWSTNLGFRDVPIRDLVAEKLGLPAALGHDVRAGALAEARLGAGRSTDRMLFLAIGTGIAGGFALRGQIDPGAHGAAGELGHLRVRTEPSAQPCGCGQTGCLEAYASANSIERAYAAAGDEPATAAEIAARVAAGEPRARAVWDVAVEALADGLLAGVALYDPELVVLGGGLAGAGDLLLDPLAAAMERKRTFHRMPRLTLAQLGDVAGCLGAALLALDLAAKLPRHADPVIEVAS
jgi:glucokinase